MRTLRSAPPAGGDHYRALPTTPAGGLGEANWARYATRNRPTAGAPDTAFAVAEGGRTTLVGKWHLGGLPAFSPLKSGYDRFYGFRGGALEYYRHTAGADTPDLWDEEKQVSQEGYSPTCSGIAAVKVISDHAHAGQSFFLSLHFNAPHWPWEAPGDQAESDRLRGRGLDDWDGVHKRLIAG